MSEAEFDTTRPSVPLDLAALRKVAQEAEPGPWTLWDDEEGAAHIYGAPPGKPFTALIEWHGSEGQATSLHIATFDPLTVLSLLDRIEELEKDLGLERIIRESAQDTAKRLGNAIDAHEGAAGSCHFPWHQHDVKAFPSHLSPTEVIKGFRGGMKP